MNNLTMKGLEKLLASTQKGQKPTHIGLVVDGVYKTYKLPIPPYVLSKIKDASHHGRKVRRDANRQTPSLISSMDDDTAIPKGVA